MNAHTPITPLDNALRLHGALGNLVAALTRSGGLWSTNAMLAELEAVKIAADLWTAQSLEDEIANLEQELGIGECEPFPVFDPGMVHPDDGCQRKGLVW